MTINTEIGDFNSYLFYRNYEKNLIEGLTYTINACRVLEEDSVSTRDLLEAVKKDFGMAEESASLISSWDSFHHNPSHNGCNVCQQCNEGLERIDRKGGVGCHVSSLYRLYGESSLIESDRKKTVLIKIELDFYTGATNFNLHIAHNVKEQIVLNQLNLLIEAKEAKPDKSQVAWKFLYKSMDGIDYTQSNLTCPSWNDIKDNYRSREVAEQIEKLISLEKPYKHGKLIFWHGEPGTGKTYAIRALAKEWKNANFVYVTQPVEILNDFGGFHQFLLEQCIRHEEETANNPTNCSDQVFPVLIIEDALDLILEETRKKDSATISKLLNLTEGIVGQGLRLIVLVTSNEPMSSVDPAFLRPGRSLQTLEFTKLTKEESAKWLKNKGVEPERIEDRSHTLSELYQYLSEGLSIDNKKQKLGFTI